MQLEDRMDLTKIKPGNQLGGGFERHHNFGVHGILEILEDGIVIDGGQDGKRFVPKGDIMCPNGNGYFRYRGDATQVHHLGPHRL